MLAAYLKDAHEISFEGSGLVVHGRGHSYEAGGGVLPLIKATKDSEPQQTGLGVKEFAIRDMRASGMLVAEYSHDCACQFKRKWEELKLVKCCKLDGFHWKTHKCNVAKVSNPRFNSQAAEQLWSRLDNLHFMTEYSRARYRYFLRNYFVWRNNFLRVTQEVDTNSFNVS